MAICKSTSVGSLLSEEAPAHGLDVSRVAHTTIMARERILMEFDAELDAVFSSLAAVGWSSALLKNIRGKLHCEVRSGHSVQIKSSSIQLMSTLQACKLHIYMHMHAPPRPLFCNYSRSSTATAFGIERGLRPLWRI